MAHAELDETAPPSYRAMRSRDGLAGAPQASDVGRYPRSGVAPSIESNSQDLWIGVSCDLLLAS